MAQETDRQDRSRIAELESLISRYQESYYNGEGEVSDAEFDRLWDELKQKDPSNPILQRVGADSGNFAKAGHIMPMGSQEKAATPEEFLAWAARHRYDEYLVEYKLDGASLELQYGAGRLIRAVTRGDGSVGDDITANAVRMQGVRQELRSADGSLVPFTGGIRGEVIMTHAVHKQHFSDKANCRNAANGLMKRKDGSGSGYLTLITYDVWASKGGQPYADEVGKLDWLAALGFTTSPLRICRTPEEVIDYRASVMEGRGQLDYDIDGLVIKERAVNHEDAMRARPDRQIAFKFSLEEAVTVVRQVEWGESGATYTPVAVFDPVELNGTTVQRASVVNPNTIRNLGLRIGSHVVVVKRGEIIPKIESVIPSGAGRNAGATGAGSPDGSGAGRSGGQLALFPGAVDEQDIVFPTVCSSCGSTLVDEGTRLFCPNRACPKRLLHQIMKWVNVVDIRDLGEKLIRALFQDGVLRSVSDIYTLTEEKLSPYFLGEESLSREKQSLGAKKVIQSIQAHRRVSLERFIAGFDIEGIGETVVEKLTEAGYGSLEKILALTPEQAASVYGFADIMAKTLVEGLAENRDEMQALVGSGTISLLEKDATLPLTGMSFCFTGELRTMKRTDAQNLVKEQGGSVKSSVVKGLCYLVTNDTASGSAKNEKAAKLGIPVIDEDAFLALVSSQTQT